MVYSTTKCPYCGNTIRKQTNPVNTIGDPFERCHYCGKTYRNTYKEEWITKSPIRRFFFFLQSGVWARALAIPFLLVGGLCAIFEWDNSVFWAIWPFLALAWLICGYFLHKKWEQADISESLERTKNPEYVEILKQAGYKIYPLPEDAYATRNPSQEKPKHSEPIVTKNEICFCRKCGQKLASDSLYCHKCGEKVKTDIN